LFLVFFFQNTSKKVLVKNQCPSIFAPLLRISLNKDTAMSLKYFLPFAIAFSLVSCSSDDDAPPTENPNLYDVPQDYTFEDADGISTVSYQGQVDRLNQLAQMTILLKTGNTSGVQVSSQALLDMFSNVNGNGNGNFDFTSTKQLKDKCGATFADAADIQAYYENWMEIIGEISATTISGHNDASNGVSGTIESAGAGPYLLTAEGFEPTQMIEKGLMGAVFYNQITGVYLSDDKVGNSVDNTNLVEGENYTAMEHHWDEAFGYFVADPAFPQSGTDMFWGKYTNNVDEHLGSNTILMDAFIRGRAAITNKDMATKDAMRAIIITELERVVAATAVHYFNSANANFANSAIRNHALSECYAFLNCLRYNPNATISTMQINDLQALIGDNLYEVTMPNLTMARNNLSDIFGFEAVKELL
jgi:hypothetical protein